MSDKGAQDELEDFERPQPQVEKKSSPLTEAQVKAALRQDKGSGATLLSWTTQDLTKKGDNFMGTLKRLNVSFSQDGQNLEVAYVVKAKQEFVDGMKELNNIMFEKECLFYSILVPLLNAELQSANLEPLRLPRYNFHSLEENAEVLIMEDVTQLGFKMVDRKNGLDAAHAELVFLELARLHAASYLLQTKLPSGNLAEEYSFLTKEWFNFSEGAEREIGPLFQSDVNILVKVVETVDGYKEVLTWLKALAPRTVDVFKEQMKTQDPFAVICHGDCWTNNFLFRYNESGRPIEVVLVDMQLCRRGSPALDLNTVVYSSISGEVRSASFSHLLHAYFASFTSVMKARDAALPFTYDALLQEYHKRNIFGLLVAAAYLPTALVEADDTPDYTQMGEEWMKQREETIKTIVTRCPLLVTWMCSTLDDMIEFGVVGNGSHQADPVCQKLQVEEKLDQVTEAQVKAALRQDKGSGTTLISWTTEEFTKKGDNFMCTVNRLNVSFSQDGQNLEVAYVVKAKQEFVNGMKDFANMAFEKECLFYSMLVPLLNAELKSANLEPLRLPRYNFHSLEENAEVLIMEDVTQLGFKMVDRKNGLDAAHAELVFLELARLHAASYLLQTKLPSGNLAEEYSFLTKDWSNYSEGAEREIGQVMQNDINILVKAVETVDGYEEVLTWLKALAPRIMDVFKEQIKSQDPFAVLCHGDCWTGNFLFRYDESGRPIDVVLVDMQWCRRGSPALDLNTVVYSSISGEVRSASFSHLLHAYFASFTSVMKARDAALPFTYDALLQEYHKRNIFGLMQAASVLPTTLVDASDMPDFTQVGEEWMKQREEKIKSMVARYPHLVTWMCSVLDDMVEFGVVDKASH
ncbi:uncharacterized protein [Procambarus clarkii]|uniref:uncharacterized protein n=1 Tax=Procambarus clarkii TaxID=6728 RepID=UPI003743891C